MPFYSKLGNIPHKRHTVFKKEDGTCHYEQLFGTEGFSGMSSLLYHVNRPTQVKASGKIVDLKSLRKIADDKNLKSRLLKGFGNPYNR